MEALDTSRAEILR